MKFDVDKTPEDDSGVFNWAAAKITFRRLAEDVLIMRFLREGIRTMPNVVLEILHEPTVRREFHEQFDNLCDLIKEGGFPNWP